MRRPARWLLNTLTALSLLLCLATIALWPWSYWRFVDVGRNSSRRDAAAYTQHVIRLGSDNGRFLFTRRDLIFPWADPPSQIAAANWQREDGWYLHREPPFNLYQVFPPQPGDRSWRKDFAGCRFSRLLEPGGPSRTSAVGVFLIVPHAYAVAALALLPAVRAWRLLRRRRAAARVGLCQACSYNLTGNVSGVCPECGSVITQVAP